MLGLRKVLRAHRYLLLLVAMIALAVAQPMSARFDGGVVVFDVVTSLLMVAVVLVVFRSKRQRLVAFTLAVPAVVTKWMTFLLPAVDDRTLSIVHHTGAVVFLGYAIFRILRGIFDETEIQRDHLVGTICGYMLAGIAWGNAYTAIDLYSANAFRITPEILAKIDNEHFRSAYFNYFSLCTLTNAGFGDISPTASFATTLTWLEAAFGQFYIAVVVAQLVGLRLAQALRGVVPTQNKSFAQQQPGSDEFAGAQPAMVDHLESAVREASEPVCSS